MSSIKIVFMHHPSAEIIYIGSVKADDNKSAVMKLKHLIDEDFNESELEFQVIDEKQKNVDLLPNVFLTLDEYNQDCGDQELEEIEEKEVIVYQPTLVGIGARGIGDLTYLGFQEDIIYNNQLYQYLNSGDIVENLEEYFNHNQKCA